MIANKAEVPLQVNQLTYLLNNQLFDLFQNYVVRNDSPCGTTIGPILSTNLNIRTIDVGTPQLAMHSIRELADSSSISQAITLYKVSVESFIQNRKSISDIL